jgi:hypothetical protein
MNRRTLLALCTLSGALLAFQDTLANLNLNQKHIENNVNTAVSSLPHGNAPVLPKPAVEAYKALDNAAKVAAVKEILALAKAYATSEAYLSSKDQQLFNSYGAKDHGLKVINQEALLKMSGAAQQKAMQDMMFAGAAHEAYRGDLQSLRRNLENDLRGAEYMAKEMPTMKPDPKRTVDLLKAALAIPASDEAAFRKAAAMAKISQRAEGPLTGIDPELLAKQEAQRLYNEHSPKGKLRGGLEKFIETAGKVNFNATLVPKGNKMVFATPDMERASSQVKFLYRLGKGPTDAAVVFAKAWLAEMK